MWQNIDTDAIDRRLMQDVVGDILNTKLSERERTVLVCRFWGEMTLKETAKYCGVTRERVRQNECKAFRKLLKDDVVEIFAKCGVLAAEKALKARAERERQELIDQQKAKVLKKPYSVIYADWKPFKKKEREFPEYKDKIIESSRRSILPPLQVTLAYTPEGIPYLYMPSWMGNIVRAHDPERYDEWMEWLKKHGNHVTKDRRNIWE